jgi:AP-4 complex subunit epsilon-1
MSAPPVPVGVHKTKSRAFYEFIRQIGASQGVVFCRFATRGLLTSRLDCARETSSRRLTRAQFSRYTGECKSKSDEDVIMQKESMYLRALLGAPKIEKERIREIMLRLMYLEMLGHDASFGYIHAVKACVESDVTIKRSGYLATSSFLNENHDLIILIVNTVQQDLRSDDYLVVCAALTTITELVNEDTVPAVLPQVVDLLMHSVSHVRKKAVMALARFYQKSPQSVSHLHGKFREMICDKDPSVMSAAVCALYELISTDPTAHKNLTSSFVSVLKQVIDRRLPKAYEYHKTPAPFVQIKLLKILAILGAHDRETSSEMYSVLEDTLARAELSKNQIGNALVYETVRTIASIYPNPQLLAQCALVISRFIKSRNNNLKYVGLNALACIVNVNPSYAAEHQMAVVDCLEDQDETLRKKTLDLLYKMTKPNNVEVIVERMLAFLKRDGDRYSDQYMRAEAASRVAELAERYAPDAKWYVETMTALFESAGDAVKPSIGQSLMRLIAEGTGDAVADELSRKSAVNAYVKLFKRPKLPLVLLQVMVWVIGEFGELSGKSSEELMDLLIDAVDTQMEGNAIETLALSAIAKIATRSGGSLSAKALRAVERNTSSKSITKQQRANEIMALMAESPSVRTSVLAPYAMELTIDRSLAVMNQHVANALAQGAKSYQSKAQRDAEKAAAAEAQSKAIESSVMKAKNSRGTGPLVFEHHKADVPQAPPPRQAPVDDLDMFLGGGATLPATTVAAQMPPPQKISAPEVDESKAKLADALFGNAPPRKQESVPVTLAGFAPPPRGPPTMRSSALPSTAPFDLLSALDAPAPVIPAMTNLVPSSSSSQTAPVDLLSQLDLISASPAARPQQSSANAPVAMSGGAAKGNHAKDPFADLFSSP